MYKIYSKLEPDKLLHIVLRLSDIQQGRNDLITPENFIQCSSLNLPKGTTFKPHKHIRKTRTWDDIIAQESWHVIQGSVECSFYDIDDTLLEKVVINQGDTSFTLEGGHNYLILEHGTKVLEYKTGKYEGQLNDKIFLSND